MSFKVGDKVTSHTGGASYTVLGVWLWPSGLTVEIAGIGGRGLRFAVPASDLAHDLRPSIEIAPSLGDLAAAPAWQREGGEFPGFCDACGGHRKHRLRCPRVLSATRLA